MFPTKDSLQPSGFIQTESERMEKIHSQKTETKREQE